MQIFQQIDAWRKTREHLEKMTIGFVPTMGNLHIGHLSLVERSQKENDHTVVSIFVNQAQFNRPEDYQNYPRTLEIDLAQLEQAGVDYCLLPEAQEMYADHYQFQIHETTHPQQLEGKYRPDHFTGVLTVVMKLLNLVQPNRVYLGEKDAEQLQYIQKMVQAFFMNIEVIGCPTLREASGLAFSSRNNRLSPAGRQTADTFAQLFLKATSCDAAKQALQEAQIEIEYIEEYAGRRFAAVIIDGVRLIDNYKILDH